MKKKFVLLILLIFTLSPNVFAESKPTGCELSEEYKKWLETKDEEKSIISMPKMCKEIKKTSVILPEYNITPFASETEQRTIPSSYDLRNVNGYNYVSDVKDQRQTGTCWANSTMDAIESNILLNNETLTKDDYVLSAIHNSYYISENYFDNNVKNDEGSSAVIVGAGADRYIAASYLTKLKGPIYESAFPMGTYYDSNESIITDGFDYSSNYAEYLLSNYHLKNTSLENVKNQKPIVDVNDIEFYNFEGCNTNTINEIKKLIMNNGAIKSHVYSDNAYTNGAYIYYNGSNYANHAITIIGWDDNISKSKFKYGSSISNNGAFLIKNTWGTDYGIDGYYYVSYEDVHICDNIEVFKNIDFTIEDNVYYYDKLGYIGSYGWGGNETTAWAANTFSKKNNDLEVLKEISFATRYKTDYEVYLSITTDLNDRELLASGTANQEGYTTIKLDTPIILEDNFSIIVKYTGQDGWPIAVQSSNASGYGKTYIEEGKSFVSLQGESWYDNTNGWVDEFGVTQYSIPSIKAFTDNIDYDFSLGEVTKKEETKDNFKIPITLSNMSNEETSNFNIDIYDPDDYNVTDEFIINDYISANNYIEIEKKSLDTENGTYTVAISYGLRTYYAYVEVTNSVPIRNLFVDNEFYKCVIDSFNTGKTNAEKVDYSHSLSQEELHTIEHLTCSGYTGQWQASEITSISGIELLTKLKTMDLSYMDLNNEEYVNDYILDLTDFNNLTSVKLKFTRIGKVIIGDKKDLNTIEFLNAGPSEIELGELPNLTNLIIEGGIINEINVSESPKLQTLSMINTNNISNINLSNNLELLKLNLEGNNISNIDISNNDKLIELRLNNNNLTNLNLESNINLGKLVLNDNEISNIDLSNNSELNYLMLDNNSLNSINLNNNSKLEELHIVNNNLTQLNLESLASLNELFADDNKLETITFADGLGRISLNNNNLTNIDFGENNLCSLYISNNNIENLDTSKMQCLEVLSASDNKIKSINLENNINLTNLSLNNNEINELDVTKNTKLTWLRLKNNIGLKKVYVNDIKQLDFEIGTKDKVVGYRNIKKDIAENNIIDSKETYNIKQIEAYYKDGYYYDDYPVILTDTNVTINNIGLVENARYVIPYLNSNNSVNGELELNYDYYVLNLTSETYEVNNEESYINIGEEKISNDIKNDLNLNYGDMELKNNKLQILFEDNLIKEFDIISDYKEKSMTLTKPILTPETIYDYIGGKVKLTATLENIESDKVVVNVYKGETKIITNEEYDVNESIANIEFSITAADYEPGTYTIKVTAGDYSAEETFEITLISYPEKPTLSVTGEYTYTGEEQTVNVAGYDSDTMNISGTKGTDAGTYTIKVTPKIKWSDGTTNEVTIEWTIEKAEPTVSIPTGLIGYVGEKLSTVELPENWSWTDGDTVIESSVTVYNAKYTSSDKNYKDKTQNIKITVTEKKDYVEFDNKINIHNESGSKYLKGFDANNTYKDLMNNIDTNLNVVLKESNGIKVTKDSSILKTGMKLSVGDNNYDIVIKGDMSGDGKVSITDLSQMRYHLAQAKGKVKTGAYKQAGDMNDKDGVTITDLSQMRKKLAGGN